MLLFHCWLEEKLCKVQNLGSSVQYEILSSVGLGHNILQMHDGNYDSGRGDLKGRQ